MADTTNRLAGTAYVSVDGTSYMLKGNLSYNPSSVTRKTEVGQDGVQGYSEMPFAGFIEGDFRDCGGLTVADFNAMTNVSVVAQLANGKTIVGRNMWTTDNQTVATEDGTVKVHWDGLSVVEA